MRSYWLARKIFEGCGDPCGGRGVRLHKTLHGNGQIKLIDLADIVHRKKRKGEDDVASKTVQ